MARYVVAQGHGHLVKPQVLDVFHQSLERLLIGT